MKNKLFSSALGKRVLLLLAVLLALPVMVLSLNCGYTLGCYVGLAMICVSFACAVCGKL